MSKLFISIFLVFLILFNQIIKLNADDDTYINSSNITYNENENIIELAENSKINFKDINILIDKGIIDYDKNEFEVFGNFYLYEELTILSGQNLKGNTSLDVFSANNVSFIYNDDLKIDSDSINKDENLIYFYNNFLTPCELEGFLIARPGHYVLIKLNIMLNRISSLILIHFYKLQTTKFFIYLTLLIMGPKPLEKKVFSHLRLNLR